MMLCRTKQTLTSSALGQFYSHSVAPPQVVGQQAVTGGSHAPGVATRETVSGTLGEAENAAHAIDMIAAKFAMDHALYLLASFQRAHRYSVWNCSPENSAMVTLIGIMLSRALYQAAIWTCSLPGKAATLHTSRGDQELGST
mmetsp:Transcript_33460/g.77744  ORF Transcript_33460/g.77744 Transcript_33460/m.77744 type:complete len:142 (+) Transcript_33460:726-1151(+)